MHRSQFEFFSLFSDHSRFSADPERSTAPRSLTIQSPKPRPEPRTPNPTPPYCTTTEITFAAISFMPTSYTPLAPKL